MRNIRLEINHSNIFDKSILMKKKKTGVLQLTAVIDRMRFNRAELYLKNNLVGLVGGSCLLL